MNEVIATAAKEALSIANDAKYAIVSTVDENNAPRARPMSKFNSSSEIKMTNIDTIYFNTRYEARKMSQLLNNNNINVTFFLSQRSSYVSFGGTVHMLPENEKLKHWNEKADRIWFPYGPNSMQYSVFRVDVHSIDILSNKLRKYFGPNAKFPECNRTSTPFVMNKNPINKQWTVTHPLLSFSKL
eukprot:344220_1